MKVPGKTKPVSSYPVLRLPWLAWHPVTGVQLPGSLRLTWQQLAIAIEKRNIDSTSQQEPLATMFRNGKGHVADFVVSLRAKDVPGLHPCGASLELEASNVEPTYLRLDRAQDANLHLTKKCGTGFQKAAQNCEQRRTKWTQFKARQGSADAPQGCKPALGQEVLRWLPQSNSVSAGYLFS